MSTDGLELDGGVSVPAGWNGSVFPVESQDKAAEAKQDGDGYRYEVCSEATSGWTRRIGKAPDEREMNPDRKSALEMSVRAFAENGDGHVVNPKIGTSFHSLDEAYEFYNLYSWETGFGIRLAKSRLNVNRKRCMQEIVCACAGTPLKENSRSSRCGCNAMIRLLRSKNAGWYISEHKVGHNHPLSVTPKEIAPKEVICRRLQGNCRNARTVEWLDIVAMFAALKRPDRLSQTSSRFTMFLPKAPRKLPKCTNCGVVGHRHNVCGTKKTGPFEPNFL